MEKTANLQQMLQAIADPAIRRWAGKRGLVLGDWSGQRNILDVVNKASYEKKLTEALYGAAQKDRPTWERLMRGMATLTGNQWTPDTQAHAENLSGDFAKVAPYFMRWAPDVWDTMHGSKGSVASLTHAIAESRKNDPNFDPAAAYKSAAGVFDELYGGDNPMTHRGFSAAEMGKIYQEAAKRGLIDTNGSPEVIAKSLAAVAGPVSAIRDSIGRQGLSDVSMADTFKLYDQVVNRTRGSAADVESELRKGDYLTQMGASSPFNLALQQGGGLQGSGTGISELTDLDTQLTQQAASSQVGNIVAATARIEQTFGLPQGTPGAALMDQIRSGSVPAIDQSQWIQAMQQSGVDASMAASMLASPAENQQFMRPEYVSAVRQSQYATDIAPQLSQLPPNASKAEQVRQQMEVGRVARGYGYRSGAQMQMLHGPAVQSAGNILNQAEQQASQASQASPYGRGGPLARTVDVISNATPQTGIKELVSRGIFNAVPQRNLPKTSLGRGMARGVG